MHARPPQPPPPPRRCPPPAPSGSQLPSAATAATCRRLLPTARARVQQRLGTCARALGMGGPPRGQQLPDLAISRHVTCGRGGAQPHASLALRPAPSRRPPTDSGRSPSGPPLLRVAHTPDKAPIRPSPFHVLVSVNGALREGPATGIAKLNGGPVNADEIPD